MRKGDGWKRFFLVVFIKLRIHFPAIKYTYRPDDNEDLLYDCATTLEGEFVERNSGKFKIFVNFEVVYFDKTDNFLGCSF